MMLESELIPGLYAITSPVHEDARGVFMRTYDEEAFLQAGLPGRWPEQSISINPIQHTLRGLHWQAAPHAEGKLIRCVAGSAYDVIVDVRESLPSFGRFEAFTLEPRSGLAIYAPPGTAHGFLTLEPNTTISYQMSAKYKASAGRRARWDDPALQIPWPSQPKLMLALDRDAPSLREAVENTHG